MQADDMSVDPSKQFMTVLCCMCGVPIAPNPSCTCSSCLASTSDVTAGIATEVPLHQCRGCQRWHVIENKWVGCDLESRELMALCLSKTNGLNSKTRSEKVRLTDASWVWTEPHSMRLKVKMTVQKEVQKSTILQQSFLVTYVVRNQQCPACLANFCQGSWVTVIQVRQRVPHKRTFLYLEQVILKHGAHKNCITIETFADGMDFYFGERSAARTFQEFLEDHVPLRLKTSRKLVSQDINSNIDNYKFTIYAEIVPLCKDDLLLLPAPLARNASSISRLCLVKQVGAAVHVVDPANGQTAIITADNFFLEPFHPLVAAGRTKLTRYVVLGKEAVEEKKNAAKRNTSRQKKRIALLTVMKERDMGVSDLQYVAQAHIGYLCKAGDVVLGYELSETMVNDEEGEEMQAAGKLPDVVIVRKLYGSAAVGDGGADRVWGVQRLDVDNTAEDNFGGTTKRELKKKDDAEADEEDFMQELEANKDMRVNANLYKLAPAMKAKREASTGGSAALSADMKSPDDDDDDEFMADDQEVQLDELLDGLALEAGLSPAEYVSGKDAATGGGGASSADMDDALLDGDFDGGDDEDDDTPWELKKGEEEGARAKKDGLHFITREDALIQSTKESAVAVSTLGETFMTGNITKYNIGQKTTGKKR